MAQNTPSFNFFSNDFTSGTSLMSWPERGMYIYLLCNQHQHGHLTIEDMETICIGPVPPKVMAKFIIDEKGLYYNKKLEKVIAEKNSYCEKQAGNFGIYKGLSREQIKKLKEEMSENAEKSLPDAPLTSGESKIPKVSRQPAAKFKPPSLEEVEKYFLEHNFSKELAKRAFEGYEVAGWKDSQGKLIINWKQKMVHVWFREENKSPAEKDELLTYEEIVNRSNAGQSNIWKTHERIEIDGKAMWRKKK